MDEAEQKKLGEEFRAIASRPAPDRSLVSPNADKIAQACFSRGKVLAIGEAHDATNYKYLADNEVFFQEAAAKGARYMFIEEDASLTWLFKAHADRKISDKKFTDEFIKFGGEYNSGDTLQEMAKQSLALSKTARDNGITILPSNFRILKDRSYTSDIYGIPDIQHNNDLVHRLTMQSLEEFKSRTGRSAAGTADDLKLFRSIHKKRVAGLGTDETRQLG